MSEWIKFSFSTQQDFKAWLTTSVDGVEVADSTCHIGADATSRDVWVEIDDAVASGSGSHNIQINVQSNAEENPDIDLDSIQLMNQTHTNETGSINDELTTYCPNTAEYQGLDTNVDSTGTHNIGGGDADYAVSNWVNKKVIGDGAWKLTFSCPFEDWFNTVHND